MKTYFNGLKLTYCILNYYGKIPFYKSLLDAGFRKADDLEKGCQDMKSMYIPWLRVQEHDLRV